MASDWAQHSLPALAKSARVDYIQWHSEAWQEEMTEMVRAKLALVQEFANDVSKVCVHKEKLLKMMVDQFDSIVQAV
jgi:hypothetical protein